MFGHLALWILGRLGVSGWLGVRIIYGGLDTFLIFPKSFGDSFGNSCIPCLQVIIVHRFTCGERKIWLNIKKSQNIMQVIVDLSPRVKRTIQ